MNSSCDLLYQAHLHGVDDEATCLCSRTSQPSVMSTLSKASNVYIQQTR